jgi:hypothetical protein
MLALSVDVKYLMSSGHRLATLLIAYSQPMRRPACLWVCAAQTELTTLKQQGEVNCCI